MLGNLKIKAFGLVVAILWLGLSAVVGNAQVYQKPTNPTPKPTATPYFQDIIIQPSKKQSPTPTPTPLVNKTASVTPTSNPDIVNPAASEINVGGYTGVLIETLDGKVVKENYSNYAFNPASNVKVATAFAVIKTFGPDYRFPTNVYTDGTVDTATGTLNGNLYVAGRDPNFNFEHGIAVAQTLNKMGIRQVNGDLIVTNTFIMSFNGSYQRSAETLFATLDISRRSAAANRAWQDYLTSAGKFGQAQAIPSVSFTGGLYVDILPTNARLLFAHESAPLREIVKVTNCYSNNFLAERLGDMLGGAYAVAHIVQVNAGVTPLEFSLQTSSGLGLNRVTPRAQMKLLRAFRNELARYKLTFADVMPVAGMDPGTLQNRFNTFPYQGSVVAKTGTLGQTDAGVSSLTGEMQTKSGKLLFVIFNQRGGVSRFRNFQNDYVMMVQNQQGGPAPLGYSTMSLSSRLANTRIVYPSNRVAAN